MAASRCYILSKQVILMEKKWKGLYFIPLFSFLHLLFLFASFFLLPFFRIFFSIMMDGPNQPEGYNWTNLTRWTLPNRSNQMNLIELTKLDGPKRTQPDGSQVIIDSCATPSDSLISLSYSMAAFSANSFGHFFW